MNVWVTLCLIEMGLSIYLSSPGPAIYRCPGLSVYLTIHLSSLGNPNPELSVNLGIQAAKVTSP